jgi:predicted dehydrogenase
MKVAICGASGIGKFHAQWFSQEGCEIVAFLGQTPSSIKATHEKLQSLINFQGKGYTDLEELIRKEKPDIISIATPPETHAPLVAICLEAGCHVFCEKPFIWDDSNSTKLVDEANHLMALAQKNKRILKVNTQYEHALSLYRELQRKLDIVPSPPNSFTFYMESKGSGTRKSGTDLWVDVSAHPLSLLVNIMPQGTIDERKIRTSLTPNTLHVTFPYVEGNSQCDVDIVYNIISEGNPQRKFGINGHIVNYTGFNDEHRVFKARLSGEGEEVTGEDFMHLSVKDFLNSIQEHKIGTYSKVICRTLELQAQVYRALSR